MDIDAESVAVFGVTFSAATPVAQAAEVMVQVAADFEPLLDARR